MGFVEDRFQYGKAGGDDAEDRFEKQQDIIIVIQRARRVKRKIKIEGRDF